MGQKYFWDKVRSEWAIVGQPPPVSALPLGSRRPPGTVHACAPGRLPACRRTLPEVVESGARVGAGAEGSQGAEALELRQPGVSQVRRCVASSLTKTCNRAEDDDADEKGGHLAPVQLWGMGAKRQERDERPVRARLDGRIGR